MEKMKIPWFNRWASKHGVDDSDLLDIINDLEQDVYDADLGGGLYKKCALHAKAKEKVVVIEPFLSIKKEKERFS